MPQSVSENAVARQSSADTAVPHFGAHSDLHQSKSRGSPSSASDMLARSSMKAVLNGRVGREISARQEDRSGARGSAKSLADTPEPRGRQATLSGARSASPPRSQGSPVFSSDSPSSLREAFGMDVVEDQPLPRAFSTYLTHWHTSDELATDEDMYQPRTNAVFHRPSSVHRLGDNAAIVEFSDWAQTIPDGWSQIRRIFVKEDANPAGGTHVDHGHQGMRGISKSRWIQLLGNKGFKSELAAADVFDEVSKEIRTDKKCRMDLWDESAEPTITLAQLKRFELRCVSVTATLASSDPQSPTARFGRHLAQQRGSVLRAWRSDLDKRGTGRVAYVDFCNACRSLGVSSQGKLIWNNMRQDKVAPLELHELDPREASNLEDFAEALWETVGFDLAKAWLFLDTNNQNYLTYEEFRAGAARLGFKGDARLLFRGLDGSGLGRLKRSEFDYIGKVSRVAQRKLGGCAQLRGPLTELIAWVQRELGGPDQLVRKLGLGGGPAREIVVGDLAARLTALGFGGDALAAAAKAARATGGTRITSESLYSLLCGGKCAAGHHGSIPGSPKSPKSPMSPSSARAPAPFKDVWCDGVDNLAEHNTHKCKAQRGYFSSPRAKLDEKSSLVAMYDYAPGAGKSPRLPSRNLLARPAWDDNSGHIVQASNQNVSSHSRQYFSDPSDKPVRDERRALIEQKRMAMAARMGMLN